METRRSSSRLKNQSTKLLSTKRKSASPEPEFEANVTSPKKLKVDLVVPSKSSVLDTGDKLLESFLDKVRHDSIEKCVAGAANVNLSSDSESDDSLDGTPQNKAISIDVIEHQTEGEPEVIQASEYFDFSKILSKQNSFHSLLGEAKNDYSDKTSQSTSEQHNQNNVDGTTENHSKHSKKSNTEKAKKTTNNESLKTEKCGSRSSSRNKSSHSSSKRKSKKTVESKENKPKSSIESIVDDDLNVKELLAIGEGVDTSQLANLEEEESVKNDYKIPEKVEITLDLPNAHKKKKKSGFDLEAALKRRLNLVKKEHQVYVHKVHLLCLLSHGFHLNKCLNSENLIAIALSLIPSKHCYPPKHADITYLENFMSWFCKKISVEDSTNVKFNIDCSNITSQLTDCFHEHKARTKTDLILMFIAVIRSLGLKCRLIINLQPEPLKPPSDILIPINAKPKSEPKEKGETKPKSLPKNPRFAMKAEKKSSSNVSKYFQSESNDSKSKYFKENTKESAKSKPSNKPSNKKSNPKSKKGKFDLSNQPSCSKSKEDISIDSDYIMSDEDSDDADFVSPKKKSTKKSVTKNSPQKESKINRKVLSSESEPDTNSPKVEKKRGLDVWCELFLEAEEKWISVDIVNKRYHCVEKLYSSATHPVSYVLGWNNNNTVKDLTKRYAPQWLTSTQKLRVDPSWWRKTLKPYTPPASVWEREEDEEMETHLKDQPLPLSASEYKNHPLYVLSKDLLKFQSIHPPDIAPVGYFRGEKVYPRSAVKELHTRETWLKEARVVRLGETPYKIVKARVKKDKFGFLPTEEKKSELFGIWQTEDYIPPVAQNGVVPRNSFGNVDLFLECMLPTGTLHLQLPQLQRIARKLNIDCAPAMVGFEPCRFGSRPVMDGWVVCEEFRDVLLDAWNQEYDEKTRTENEKRRKRAVSNWRKLFRSWRVKKRLERRYQFNLEPEHG